MSGGLGGKSTGEREILRDIRNESRRLSPQAKATRKAERSEARRLASVQKILNLAEHARDAAWGDNAIEEVCGTMDDLIALAVKLGAVESPEDGS